MGKCLEFAVTITAGCEHSMDAQADCCTCEVCGARCTGKFGGCPAVWAATTAPLPVAMGENGNGNGSAPPEAALAAIEADLAIDWASDAPSPVTVPDPRLESHSRRRSSQDRQRRKLGAIAAAVAIAGVGLGLLLATRGAGSEVGVNAVRPPELQFKTVAVSDTVDLERNWRLEGASGNRFIGTLTFSNSADTVSAVTYDETLPKTLADNVNVVLFEPYPIVIDPDPVFQYQLQIDPHASVTVTYEVQVPPDGADAKRLDKWAKDVEQALEDRVAEAEAALAAANTAAEKAAAQAFLDAARAAQRSFKPTPKAPGCKYCGGTVPSNGGGGGVTSSTDCSTSPNGCEPPLITTTTQEVTTTTEEVTTTTEEVTTTTEETTVPTVP